MLLGKGWGAVAPLRSVQLLWGARRFFYSRQADADACFRDFIDGPYAAALFDPNGDELNRYGQCRTPRQNAMLSFVGKYICIFIIIAVATGSTAYYDDAACHNPANGLGMRSCKGLHYTG